MASTLTSDKLVSAAVLIPILLDAGPKTKTESSAANHPGLTLLGSEGAIPLPPHAEILFTIRTQNVEHHKGQISFPGGVMEPQDLSLEETALRECHEEIGLRPEDVEIVAELPDVPTYATKFVVRPFVGLIRRRPEFKINPDEIEEMLLVPLGHLVDPDHSVLENYERNGVRYQLKAYHFGTHRIWGATGIMLQILLERYLK